MSDPKIVPVGAHAARAIKLARQLYHLSGDFHDLMESGLEYRVSTDRVLERETGEVFRKAEENAWAMVKLYLQGEAVGDYPGVGKNEPVVEDDADNEPEDESEAPPSPDATPAETRAADPAPAELDGAQRAANTGAKWEVYDAAMNFVGFLVTELDDHDRFVAMAWSHDSQNTMAMKAVGLVAEDAEWAEVADVFDFRSYCKLDSPHPMPAFAYAWKLAPFGSGIQWATIRPAPFCRFRLAKMVAQHNAMRFTSEEREQYPIDCVGMRDEENDSSVDYEISIACRCRCRDSRAPPASHAGRALSHPHQFVKP